MQNHCGVPLLQKSAMEMGGEDQISGLDFSGEHVALGRCYRKHITRPVVVRDIIRPHLSSNSQYQKAKANSAL